MIVVMKRGATPEMVQRMVRNVEEMGLKVSHTERTLWLMRGEDRTGKNDFRLRL